MFTFENTFNNLDTVLILARISCYSDFKRLHLVSSSLNSHLRNHTYAIQAKGALIVTGGVKDGSGLNSVERLDFEGGRWIPLAPLRQGRSRHLSAFLLGKLYVAGGAKDDEVLNSCESLILGNSTWESVVSMTIARDCPGGAASDGCLYVCGGTETIDSDSLRSAECLRASHGEWEQLPSMRENRERHGSAMLNGCLFVCGGMFHDRSSYGYSTNFRPQPRSSVEYFDPSTKQWRLSSPMNKRRNCPRMCCINGCLYVYGGDYDLTLTLERFNPNTIVWELLDNVKTNIPQTGRGQLECPVWGMQVAAVAGQMWISGGQAFGEKCPEGMRFHVESNFLEVLPLPAKSGHQLTWIPA